VKISISSPDGRNAILNLIGAGEIFGEIALLDGSARSADATANTNCELFTIDRREFIPFVRSQPALAMKFIELLCTRIALDQRSGRAGHPAESAGRLASALLRLTEKHKLAPQGRTIAITQQEISEMVGMTRESINKQLRAWAARELGAARARRHRRAEGRAAAGTGRSRIRRRRRIARMAACPADRRRISQMGVNTRKDVKQFT
jgi:CRP/FNR family cyclic AMP-dependent transcriptional regulator